MAAVAVRYFCIVELDTEVVAAFTKLEALGPESLGNLQSGFDITQQNRQLAMDRVSVLIIIDSYSLFKVSQ